MSFTFIYKIEHCAKNKSRDLKNVKNLTLCDNN